MSDTSAALERIREITARAAQAAALEPIAPHPHQPPSPLADHPADAKPERGVLRHWSEVEHDEDEHSAPARARLQLEAGDVAARDTACARLRELLADGRWHSALELVEAGGLRYGGRLHEIRRGLDGGLPLDMESQAHAHGARQVWWYRARAEPHAGRLA